jgi:hypothetical protein
LRVIGLLFGCDCCWVDEEELESRDVRPTERSLEYLDVDGLAILLQKMRLLNSRPVLA